MLLKRSKPTGKTDYTTPAPPALSLDFLKENNIAWHHVGADEFLATYDPLSEEAVLEALELILDPANVPCAVMCNQGRHRTGVVVGVLRKLQRWNLVSILEE